MWDDETVDSIIINNHEELSINGTGLTADSNGVIYSENVAEWFGYNYSDERNEYGECSMTYYYPAYSVSFTYNKFYEVYLIEIRRLYSGQDDYYDYSWDDTADVNEPLENYSYLSGSYVGNLYEQSTLSIGIYTSQEEGETAIGGADIYVTDGEYYYYNYGLLYVAASGIYMVETETGETGKI